MSEQIGYRCHGCGICCIVPDISTLGKPMWVPCVHLGADRRCAIYEQRPLVCRNYRPDSVCGGMESLPSERDRVIFYANAFELTLPAKDE